jgi:hypothetical protein
LAKITVKDEKKCHFKDDRGPVAGFGLRVAGCEPCNLVIISRMPWILDFSRSDSAERHSQYYFNRNLEFESLDFGFWIFFMCLVPCTLFLYLGIIKPLYCAA